MKVYDVNVNDLPKGLQVQYSDELKTVRFAFESETDDGEFVGTILTMSGPTARELAFALLDAANRI